MAYVMINVGLLVGRYVGFNTEDFAGMSPSGSRSPSSRSRSKSQQQLDYEEYLALSSPPNKRLFDSIESQQATRRNTGNGA